MAIFFGTLFVGAIIYLKTNYALGGEIGSFIVTFAIKEFAPLFTILIIAFRSSIAVNVNIALMSINGKLNTQERYGFEFMKVVFIPRVLNGVISSVLLSSVFCLIMIFGGYVFALLYMSIDFDTYKDLLIGSIGFNDLAVLILKSMAFGFFSMLIPIYSALSVKTFEELPKVLLSSMFGIFIAVFFIEVVSLLVGSI